MKIAVQEHTSIFPKDSTTPPSAPNKILYRQIETYCVCVIKEKGVGTASWITAHKHETMYFSKRNKEEILQEADGVRQAL